MWEYVLYLGAQCFFFCLYLRAQCFFFCLYLRAQCFFVCICVPNVFFVYICVPNVFFVCFVFSCPMFYIRLAWKDKSVKFSCVSNCFYFALRSRSPWTSAQTYEKCSELSIFSRLSPFLRLFGIVKEWIITELHEMLRISHVVACPIDFILLWDQSRQRGSQKLIKNDYF